MKFIAGTIAVVSTLILFLAPIGHVMSGGMDQMAFDFIWSFVGPALLFVHFISSCFVGAVTGFLTYALLQWSHGLRSNDSAGQGHIVPKQESALRLVTVALGWILLAAGVRALAFEATFLAGVAAGASGATGPTAILLLTYIGPLGFAAALLTSARVQGRLVGDGDMSSGLGNTPIARYWLLAGMAILTALYALVVVYTSHKGFPAAPFQKFPFTLWLYYVLNVFVAVVGSLSEELLLRGWLWTGLRRHWGVLLTALVTSGLWLVLYFDWIPMRTRVGWGFARMAVLVPIAILLPLARHFGQSVRAPILLHVVYNLITTIGPWL
jgi:membrane protease YdiL (CAAX protease family)